MVESSTIKILEAEMFVESLTLHASGYILLSRGIYGRLGEVEG